MSESKKSSAKAGESVEVKEGAKVRRPDGMEVTVTGGSYVLSQTGDYEIDGNALSVK